MDFTLTGRIKRELQSTSVLQKVPPLTNMSQGCSPNTQTVMLSRDISTMTLVSDVNLIFILQSTAQQNHSANNSYFKCLNIFMHCKFYQYIYMPYDVVNFVDIRSSCNNAWFCMPALFIPFECVCLINMFILT